MTVQRLWGVASAIAVAGVYALLEGDSAGAFADGVGITGVTAIVIISKRRGSGPRLAWWVVAAALAVWVLGDQGVGVEELVRGSGEGRPDPLVLAAYPLLGAGLFLLSYPETASRESGVPASLGLMFLGPSVLVATFLLRSPADGALDLGLFATMLLGVGGLAVAAVSLATSRRLDPVPGSLLGLGLAVLLGGMLIDATSGSPTLTSRWVDGSWVAAVALLGFGAGSADSVDRVVTRKAPHLASYDWQAMWGITGLVLASVVAVATNAETIADTTQGDVLLAAGSVALCVLIVWRIATFISEAERMYGEMEQLLDRIEDGFVALDRDGRFMYVNRRIAEMFGRDRDEVLGALMADEYPQLLRTPAGRKVGEAMLSQESTTDVSYYPDFGAWWRIQIYPSPEGASLFLSDVTEAHLAEQRMRLHTAALDSAADMVVITNTDHVVEYVNEAFVIATGYQVDEAVGRRLAELSSLDANRSFLEEGLPTVLKGEPWRGVVLNQRKDGTFYPEELAITPILDDDGTCTHFVVIKRDRTEWKQREDRIAALSEYDQLTGLTNRDVFTQELAMAAATASEGSPGVVLHFDVDRFHLLNDTVGHVAGDRLLCEVAALLRRSIRHTDVVSRVGGDQFAALLRKAGPGEAFALADRLREKIERLSTSEESREFSSSVSVGLAVLDGTAPGSEVLRRGDVACNAAKVRGGNRVEIYHPEEEELMRAADDGKWVARVRDALREGRFTQHYQPIVSLRTNEVHHHEVLARLVDTDGSIIPAAAFMPAVERQGLIGEIDRLVVAVSLERIATAVSQGIKLPLTINLSGLAFSDETMLEYVCAQLADSQVDPALVIFEITETAAVANLEKAKHFIETLRAIGCRFALDDFGTGFSSFAYLRSFPIDYIKIDGAFLKNLDEDLVNQLVVSSINEIAHFLHLPTVAECVEDVGTLRLLREMGVDYAQGYLLGRPESEPIYEIDPARLSVTGDALPQS